MVALPTPGLRQNATSSWATETGGVSRSCKGGLGLAAGKSTKTMPSQYKKLKKKRTQGNPVSKKNYDAEMASVSDYLQR